MREFDTVLGIEPVWPVDKWSPELWARYRKAPDASEPEPCEIRFSEGTTWNAAEAVLEAAGVETEDDDFESGLKVCAVADYSEMLAVAGAYPVRSVAPARPPKGLHNATAAALSHVDDLYIAPYGLTGTNINVMVRDGGEISPHPDFGSRVTLVETGGALWHSTHVAGTIAGSGAGNSSARGMASEARLYSYDYDGDDSGELLAAKNSYNARISNHSYGHVIGWNDGSWNDNTNWFGLYSSYARDWDELVANAGLYIFKSAGNDRNDSGSGHPHDGSLYGDGEYYDCIGDIGCAKNIITVGAVKDDATITTFSSFGPTDDGRVKPDVVANGEGLYSTYSASAYGLASGTSMSSPVACGAAVLLLEQYRAQHNGIWPSAAYLKGLLIHTAEDLGRPGPDYAFGWGLVDALAAASLQAASTTNSLVAYGTLAEGEVNSYQLTLPASVPDLRVTVCWTDRAGSTAAADSLVNDLDVSLIPPDSNTVHYPYVLPYAVDGSSPTNKATTGINEWDNVEQIDISSPVDGVWTVQVQGTLVPEGPQDYVVFVSHGSLPAPVIHTAPEDILLVAPPAGSDSSSLIVSNGGNTHLVFRMQDDLTAKYSWLDSGDPGGPTYSWIDISGLGDVVAFDNDGYFGDDGESELMPIGFDFSFYGNVYTQFMVGANGVISFTPGNVSSANGPLPSSSTAPQSACVFWDDVDPSSTTGGGSVRWHSTPERLVVSWLSVPRWNTTDLETFQIIVYPDGQIIFQYNDMNGNFNSCTVGVQDSAAGTDYTQVVYNSAYVTNGLAVELTPPDSLWLSYDTSVWNVPSGASTSVWFSGSASNLNIGVYTALVAIACNDPSETEVTVPVVFVVGEDTDEDGMPDWGENFYFGGPTNASSSAIAANGINTVLQAYVAGFDPADPSAGFTISQFNPTNRIISWNTVSGRVYSVYWTDDLLDGFPETPMASGIIEGTYTDLFHHADSEAFYRIELELAP